MTLSSISRSTIYVLHSLFIIYLYQREIITIQNQDAIHMERWDPIDIIAQSFPIHNLQSYVLTIIGTTYITSTIVNCMNIARIIGNNEKKRLSMIFLRQLFQNHIWNYITMIFILFILILCIMIISGTSSTMNVNHTILSCLYVTFLAFGYFPPFQSKNIGTSLSCFISQVLEYIIIGCNTSCSSVNSQKEEGFILDNNNNNNNDNDEKNLNEAMIDDNHIFTRWIMYATIITTIPFQILNILDHGIQIQRWPIPMILGATIGHCIGCCFCLLSSVWTYSLSFWRSGKEVKIA